MSASALESEIDRDKGDAFVPVVVAASCGTASTGAIDPLAEIRDVCRRHGLWFHVDAAYGGPAVLTKSYRDMIAPLRDADSLALDPHKWLYVPVEAGLSLVRDGALMRDAFSLIPPYIRTDRSSGEVMGMPWFSEYGFQQTRGFRALKIWMSLKFYGKNGYRESIERDLSLAERLAKQICAHSQLELVTPPSLSIVCFRYVPSKLQHDEERLNDFNSRLLERIQLRGDAFLSGTVVNGQFCLRACIINFRTSEQDVDFLVRQVCEIAEACDV
jgi:glutamate/tyrosine decarboxylase-like PLP-dependent enzyme